MKKYLKTIEDIEVLRNTDTKIYSQGSDGYYQFIKGVFCFIHSDGDVYYNTDIGLDGTQYIEIPDKPDESWIGKLGWFWDNFEECKAIDVLVRMGTGRYWSKKASEPFNNFLPLTPEEVEKYTGYKVVKKEK